MVIIIIIPRWLHHYFYVITVHYELQIKLSRSEVDRMSNQEYKYFYEDEVYRITKNGTLQFGMVVENAEFASSGDESDSDEDCPVKAGQVRVSWYPHGREEVVSDKRVHLADRSLMPGDIVRYIELL